MGLDLRNDSSIVHYELKDVKHGRICAEFDPFFLQVPDDVHNVDIHYELFAENLTLPLRDSVHIDIAREDGQKLLEEHLATFEGEE